MTQLENIPQSLRETLFPDIRVSETNQREILATMDAVSEIIMGFIKSQGLGDTTIDHPAIMGLFAAQVDIHKSLTEVVAGRTMQ